MSGDRRLLFVSYGGGHITMVLPVIRELKLRHPGWHIDLMALTTAAHEARRQGFSPMGYRDFAQHYDPAVLERYAAALLARNSHALVDAEESAAYLGINYLELVERLGEQAAAHEYATKGRWAFRPVSLMRRVLGQLRPDLVVATNSPRTEQAALDVAAQMGIASLCLVDLFLPPGDPFLQRDNYADVLGVISGHARDALVGAGVRKRIEVTGNPAFDSLFDPVHREAAQRDRQAPPFAGRRTVLFPGTPEAVVTPQGPLSDPYHFARTVEQELRRIVARDHGVALLLRYHPNHTAHFQPFAEQDRVFWSDPQHRSVEQDVWLADVVVSQTTTVGLQASVAGKPVISLDIAPSRHLFPLSDYGIARPCNSLDALGAMLENTCAAADGAPVLQGGAATPRVVALIQRMLDDGPGF